MRYKFLLGIVGFLTSVSMAGCLEGDSSSEGGNQEPPQVTSWANQVEFAASETSNGVLITWATSPHVNTTSFDVMAGITCEDGTSDCIAAWGIIPLGRDEGSLAIWSRPLLDGVQMDLHGKIIKTPSGFNRYHVSKADVIIASVKGPIELDALVFAQVKTPQRVAVTWWEVEGPQGATPPSRNVPIRPLTGPVVVQADWLTQECDGCPMDDLWFSSGIRGSFMPSGNPALTLDMAHAGTGTTFGVFVVREFVGAWELDLIAGDKSCSAGGIGGPNPPGGLAGQIPYYDVVYKGPFSMHFELMTEAPSLRFKWTHFTTNLDLGDALGLVVAERVTSSALSPSTCTPPV